jgi:hypothetical protein
VKSRRVHRQAGDLGWQAGLKVQGLRVVGDAPPKGNQADCQEQFAGKIQNIFTFRIFSEGCRR